MKRSTFKTLLASVILGTALLTGCSTSGFNKAPELFVNPFTYNAFSNSVYDSAGMALKYKPFVYTGKTLVKIEYKNKSNIEYFLNKDMDVWSVSKKYVIGKVPPDLLSEIKANYTYQMISPKEGMTIQFRLDKGYSTYQSMTTKLKQVATQYSNLATLTDIGDSWEKTQGKADRDIWAMHITGKSSGTKPAVLFMGNHHAREVVTVELPMLLINHLLENYGKDKEVTDLVDNRDIWIIPMVNPDGHIKVEQGRDWRKNTDTSSGGNGVDLNRNYGYKWGTSGTSHSPNNDTYCGKSAFSEPETQAIRNFEDAHKNIKASISWHSFANTVMWPWSYAGTTAPDSVKLSEIGTQMASFSGYEPEQSSDMYPSSGDTDDWGYSQHKIFGYTIEVGTWNDGFDPPYSSMPKFWKENLPMCMYLLKTAGNL